LSERTFDGFPPVHSFNAGLGSDRSREVTFGEVLGHAGYAVFLEVTMLTPRELNSRVTNHPEAIDLKLDRTYEEPPRSVVIRAAWIGILTAMETSVMALFKETGAYLHGHFRLTSGLHSSEYLQCAKVLAIPAYAEKLGRDLAEQIKGLLGGAMPQVVVAPAIGGIVIGHEVARALQTRSYFTERDLDTNEMALRRGFEIKPGENVVVIEDVITTGGSTKEVIRVVGSYGAKVVAAGSIIDRSAGRADVGVPRVALQSLKAVAYQPDDCPLCAQGLALVKPGSRRTEPVS
jgi:orotate phosphoribosyltransferase